MSDDQEERGKNTPILYVIIAIAIAFLIAYFVHIHEEKGQNSANKSTPTLTSRKATLSDIEISESYQFPVSIKLSIVAKYDISNLELKITYYDSNNKSFKTHSKTVGDIDKGETKSVEVSLNDFSLTEIWKIEKTTYSVSRGTVSLLQ